MTKNDICRMNSGHLSAVVDIHLASFTGFFLSSMGRQFLNEFYSSVLSDETHLAFVCSTNGTISGFVVGTTQPSGFYRRTLRRNWWRFLMASTLPVLKDPVTVLKLLQRLIMVKGAVFDHHRSLLMSIAVDPAEQGKGVGRQLVSAFLQKAKSCGASSVVLSTDAINNDSVNRFYLSAGFQILRTYFTPEKRQMNEYIYQLANSDSAE